MDAPDAPDAPLLNNLLNWRNWQSPPFCWFFFPLPFHLQFLNSVSIPLTLQPSDLINSISLRRCWCFVAAFFILEIWILYLFINLFELRSIPLIRRVKKAAKDYFFSHVSECFDSTVSGFSFSAFFSGGFHLDMPSSCEAEWINWMLGGTCAFHPPTLYACRIAPLYADKHDKWEKICPSSEMKMRDKNEKIASNLFFNQN